MSGLVCMRAYIRGSEVRRAVWGGEDKAEGSVIVVGTCSKVLSEGRGWQVERSKGLNGV